MLKIRIIPTLLWKQFGLVKGTQFDSWRRVGPVLPAIKVYNQRDVDELVLVDITATPLNNPPDLESIADFSQECFVPLTVGGGINNIKQVQQLLRSGADKIIINSAAYNTPTLVTDIAQRFGTQCVVASIDARRTSPNTWECYSHSGSLKTGRCVREWAKELQERGAGEILITSIDNDGMMQGYDLELIHAVSDCVKIPVIASGGAGNYQHLIEAVKISGASAVAAASMFHFTEQTPVGAKLAMQQAGIPVRKSFAQST
jgi:cyclase